METIKEIKKNTHKDIVTYLLVPLGYPPGGGRLSRIINYTMYKPNLMRVPRLYTTDSDGKSLALHSGHRAGIRQGRLRFG